MSTNHSMVSIESNKKVEEDVDDDGKEMLEMSGGLTSILPSNIFHTILSRLSIKTLSQCRWVCKYWYESIQNPSFTNLYHSISIQNNSPSLILHNQYRDNFYLIDHQVFDSLETSTTVSITKFNRPKRALRVVGSCNGLMCLSPQPYLICNPITGEGIRLPRSPNYEVLDIIIGFGFDSTTKTYKVIRIFHVWDEKSIKMEFEIFSLPSGRWKSVGDVPYMLRNEQSHVFLNGALHWMTSVSGHPNLSEIIVSFDMGCEKFKAIPSPPGFILNKNCTSTMLELEVLGDCLCFIDSKAQDRTEIWVMKDYGVEGSWIKEYVIRHNIVGRVVKGFYHVIRLMENGEILVHYGSEVLGYYNLTTDAFRPIVTHGFPVSLFNWIPIVHVGSLISPKNVGR